MKKEKMEGTIIIASGRNSILNPYYGRRQLLYLGYILRFGMSPAAAAENFVIY
jgi:hypothetical protein